MTTLGGRCRGDPKTWHRSSLCNDTHRPFGALSGNGPSGGGCGEEKNSGKGRGAFAQPASICFTGKIFVSDALGWGGMKGPIVGGQ